MPDGARPEQGLRQSLAQLSLAITLALGLASVWEWTAPRLWPNPPPSYESYGTWFVMTPRNELLLQTTRPLPDRVLVEYTDLAGNPVPEPNSPFLIEGGYVSGSVGASPRHAWVLAYCKLRAPREYWYLVESENGTAYFVGYDARTHAIVGYVTKRGLQLAPPTMDQCFPLLGGSINENSLSEFVVSLIYHSNEDPSNALLRKIPDLTERVRYLNSGSMVYRVDLLAKTVTEVIQAPGIQRVSPSFNEATKSFRLLVTCADRLLVIDPKNGQKSFPLPASLRKSCMDWRPIPQDRCLIQTSCDGKQVSTVLAENGTIIHQLEGETPVLIPKDFATTFIVCKPSLVPLALSMMRAYPEQLQQLACLDEASAREVSIHAFQVPLFWVGCLSLLLAAVCAWIKRSRGAGRLMSAFWFLFVLLAGPVGFLGTLACRVKRASARDQETETVTTAGIEVFA